MLPRWHIILGFILSLVLGLLFPQISLLNLLAVFLSSFLIDFDHYLCAVRKTGKLSLIDALEYYRVLGRKRREMHNQGIRKKGHFHIFHTLEFHLLILIGALFWPFLWFVLLGMVFHSLLDIIYLVTHDAVYAREFFFFRWLLRRGQDE